MNGKLKAIMELLKNMDEDMLKGIDLKGKMEGSETLDAKPKMSITKVAVMKPKMDEGEMEDEEEESEMSDWMPKDEDENDPLVKLKKKFTGK